MAKNKQWTEQELGVIRSMYGKEEDRRTIMERLPGRTWASIRAMAQRHGVKRGMTGRKERRHLVTEEYCGMRQWESALIVELGSCWTAAELRMLMPQRTEHSIRLMARKLGVQLRPDEETIEQLQTRSRFERWDDEDE